MPEEDKSSNISKSLEFDFDNKNYDEYVSPEDKPSLISIAEKNSRPSVADGSKGSIMTGLKVGGKDVMAIHTGSQWKYAALEGSNSIDDMENRIREMEKVIDIAERSGGLSSQNKWGNVRMAVYSGTTSGGTQTTTTVTGVSSNITEDNFICIYGAVKHTDNAWHGNSYMSATYMPEGVGFLAQINLNRFVISHYDNGYNNQPYRVVIFYNKVDF